MNIAFIEQKSIFIQINNNFDRMYTSFFHSEFLSIDNKYIH